MFDGATPELDYMLRDQALMSAATNYFAWQARMVRPWLGRRVLEIGCGTGNFTRHLMDRELVIAVDREPQMLAGSRARLGEPENLITGLADAEEPESIAALARYGGDTCVCLNVLEHVRDDEAALGAMARAIKRTGSIVLIVPAFPALYGPIDRRLGHYRRYTRASLCRTAERAGLRLRELRYVNAAGFLGWWLNARLLRREAQTAAQIALFDRWIVPVEDQIARAIRLPFGQSLFVVLNAA